MSLALGAAFAPKHLRSVRNTEAERGFENLLVEADKTRSPGHSRALVNSEELPPRNKGETSDPCLHQLQPNSCVA